MSDFDAARIVPSTRDLFGALATRRKSLALIPLIDPTEEVASEVARLDELDVRALALEEYGPRSMEVARATKSTPLFCTAPLWTAEQCQRARFNGADGVAIASAVEDLEAVARAGQSMRLMVMAEVTDAEQASDAGKRGARGLLVSAPTADRVLALAEQLPKNAVLVSMLPGATSGQEALETLRKLLGAVDAVVVPASLHRRSDFAELLAELDG